MPHGPRPAPGCAERSPTRRPAASTPASARSISATTRTATSTPASCSTRTATSPSLRKSCWSSTRRARTGWSPSAATTGPPAGQPAARYRRSVHRHLTRVLGFRRIPFLPTLSPGPHAMNRILLVAAIGLLVGHAHAQSSPTDDRVRAADRRRGPWRRIGAAVLPGPESAGRGSGPAARPDASPRVGNAADAEAAMLPVRSARLSPGDEPRRVIRAPGLTPLFLVGDDDRSRAWLRQRRAALQELRAVGLVVNVDARGPGRAAPARSRPDALAGLRRRPGPAPGHPPLPGADHATGIEP
jgi:hypothetical protein